MQERVEAAIAGMRQAIQADGADLVVEGVEGSVARMRLVFGPDVCEECILPNEMLRSMLLTAVRKTVPEITDVSLEDPRE